jgi:hypothetical protein
MMARVGKLDKLFSVLCVRTGGASGSDTGRDLELHNLPLRAPRLLEIIVFILILHIVILLQLLALVRFGIVRWLDSNFSRSAAGSVDWRILVFRVVVRLAEGLFGTVGQFLIILIDV